MPRTYVRTSLPCSPRPADLPPHSLVVLGGRDYLMSAQSLARMLHWAGCGDCVMLHSDLDHGACASAVVVDFTVLSGVRVARSLGQCLRPPDGSSATCKRVKRGGLPLTCRRIVVAHMSNVVAT